MGALTDVAGWRALRAAYGRHGVFLGLGAGLSIDSGIPDFHELVRRLTGQCHPGAFAKLLAAGFSLPAIADMVLPDGVLERAERVRDALYRDFPYRQGAPRPGKALQQWVRDCNPTLRAVAALCASPAEVPGCFTANPSIHAIVNFNLDAVFREYLESRYPLAPGSRQTGALIRTVERPSKDSKPGKISTFYVHGYLRYDPAAGHPYREAADAVAVTERVYFDRFNEPTGTFTYAVLYLLREYPGLFVGLSMRDENLRRLLHYSVQERAKGHVARGPRSEAAVRLPARRHFAILCLPGDAAMRDMLTRSLRNLGVRAIWVRSWAEIPAGFERLRSVDEWRAVW